MGVLDKILKPTDSEGIKIAKIGAIAIVFAAIITTAPIIIGMFSKDRASNTINPSNIGSSFNVIGGGGNVYLTVSENVSETITSQVLKELQSELNGTENNITLTKEEIRLLSQALKDLDQRTSGITVLPDGRTEFGLQGGIIAGTPSIVIQEQNTAESDFNSGNYTAAFNHAQNAIKAYEAAKKYESQNILYKEFIPPESVSKIYITGAKTAGQLGNYSLAYQYAKTALDTSDTPANNEIVAFSLYWLGNYSDALKYSKRALQAEPNNSWFIGLNNEILKANATQN